MTTSQTRIALMASALACASLGGRMRHSRAAAPASMRAISAAPRASPGALVALRARALRARYVDLTHTFGPNTPHWRGFGAMTVRSL